MKIKNIIKTLIFIALPLAGVGVGLSSCSNISEDERLIYVEPAKAARNVLIEDFTGQSCVNCPDAALAIHEIQEVYGENVIAVAIHCGPYGGVSKKDPGLMTDTGKEYWATWFPDNPGQPIAKINRGVPPKSYKDWGAEVARCMKQTTDVSIKGTVDYNPSSNEVRINVVTSANDGRKAKIQAWLIEDGIIAMQKWHDENLKEIRVADYEHNHVFRTAVNGAWGEDITYGQSETTCSWSHTLKEGWKAENMSAVVFVYDKNGVEQVIQIPFLNKSEK